jgi:hypothetical protein
MKVFIRTNDLDGKTPTVVACYADETEIRDDVHGEGMTVLSVPREVIESPKLEINNGLPYLAANWRERVGSAPVKAEAKRRIDDAFSVSDQLNALHDMIDAIVRYGTDPAKWPEDARHRKVLFDERWKYVADVKAKVREHAAVLPRDPGSDKIWPHRLMKKA